MTEDKDKKIEITHDEEKEKVENDLKNKIESKEADTTEENEDDSTDSDNADLVRAMPMIPLRGLSIFPYMVLHFDIGLCSFLRKRIQRLTFRLMMIFIKLEQLLRLSKCLSCLEMQFVYWWKESVGEKSWM
jgi:hypothetical protein